MGQTNCRYLVEEDIDIGAGRLYRKEFKNKGWMPPKGWMPMRSWSPRYVHFVSVFGEVFQFRFEKFHGVECVLLTSTLHDSFWFIPPNYSIEDTVERAKKGMQRYGSKTSWSGYVCWGGYMIDQYAVLTEHLKEQHMHIESEAIKKIHEELVLRRDLYEVQCE